MLVPIKYHPGYVLVGHKASKICKRCAKMQYICL